jgi:hypothetical protein
MAAEPLLVGMGAKREDRSRGTIMMTIPATVITPTALIGIAASANALDQGNKTRPSLRSGRDKE